MNKQEWVKTVFKAVKGDLKCYDARLDPFGHIDGWMGGKMNGQKNWGFIWIDRQADGAIKICALSKIWTIFALSKMQPLAIYWRNRAFAYLDKY